MLKSLRYKLILAFVVVALISAALVMLFIRFTNIDRMNSFIINQMRSNFETALVEYYALNGSWDGVESSWDQLQSSMGESGIQPPPPAPDRSEWRFDRRRIIGLVDENGFVLVAAEPNFPLGQQVSQAALASGTAVEVDGKRVGTLVTADRKPMLSPEEKLFIERTNQALLMAAVGAVFIALLFSILLAQTLIRPLQALTKAAHKIADGDLEQQVLVRGKDEISQLAAAFNRMSQEVARVNRQRRQMTADVAHDLRSPLTVIAGYVESMQDGVLAPTPERLALIYAEIERLQSLVDDLRILSQADSGDLPINSQWLSPGLILERSVDAHGLQAERAGIKLEAQAEGDLTEIWVDEARMMQVFDNLITNALRYTPNGGRIILSAVENAGEIVLAVHDTGMGVSSDDLDRIFDRFYRSDKSRGEMEGSGIGLAIVKALVETQGGRVSAESTPGQGTKITISMPKRQAA